MAVNLLQPTDLLDVAGVSLGVAAAGIRYVMIIRYIIMRKLAIPPIYQLLPSYRHRHALCNYKENCHTTATLQAELCQNWGTVFTGKR